MNAALKSSAVVVWHHRVLGAFWALCGLAPLVSVLARSSWNGRDLFLSVFAAAIFVGTGIGFVFGSTWARRVMGILMLIAGLFHLDMFLMFAWHGNRKGLWMMFAVLCIVAYTLLFIAISALYHPENHDEKPVA